MYFRPELKASYIRYHAGVIQQCQTRIALLNLRKKQMEKKKEEESDVKKEEGEKKDDVKKEADEETRAGRSYRSLSLSLSLSLL